MIFVPVDDIIPLRSTPYRVETDLKAILQKLEESGLVINHKKCQLQPS